MIIFTQVYIKYSYLIQILSKQIYLTYKWHHNIFNHSGLEFICDEYIERDYFMLSKYRKFWAIPLDAV